MANRDIMAGKAKQVEGALRDAGGTLTNNPNEKMAGKAKKAGKGGNLVVGSKVKDVIRSSGVRAAGDLVDAVSSSVGGMLKKAIERCKANGRGTVRPQDL